MKTKNSFEQKIKKLFIRYGRIPFFLLLAMMLLFMSYEYLIQQIVVSKITQNNIENKLDEIESEVHRFIREISQVENTSNFYEQYYHFTVSTKIKGHVIVYDANNKVQFITQPSLEGNTYSKVYNRVFLEGVSRNDQHFQISSVRYESINPTTNTLIFGSTTQGKSVIFLLDPSVVQKILQHHSVNQVVLTDQNDYVIATTSPVFIGPLNKFQEVKSNNEGEYIKYSLSSKTISQGQLKIYTLVFQKPFLQQYGLVMLFMSLTLIGYRLANRRVAQRVGNEAAQSIRTLMDAVQEFKKGDLNFEVNINTNDEFELLGDEFNLMSKQLDALINRNQRLLELRKDAEIKQLEAQFNPHFLYNSLETIRYLIDYEPKSAETMILKITTLLRYSIDGKTTLVKFRDDLRYLNLYLEINKTRLDERLNYEINVEENVLNLVMPKLMIQPLIENSIKHGYKHHDTLNIQIDGFQSGKFIYITVSDDGSGMEHETLNKIKKLSASFNIDITNYGIHSIVQRLNLIYGEDSKMNIDSSSKGTTITLKIPIDYIDLT